MIAFKTRTELDSKGLLLHTLSVITLVIPLQVHIFDEKIAMLGKFTHKIKDFYAVVDQSACEKSLSIFICKEKNRQKNFYIVVFSEFMS